jgi:hypothetical protein
MDENTDLNDTRRRLCDIGFMTKNKKIRLWYIVMALSVITIVVPFVAAGLWGEKLQFRYFVIGPFMIAAALYELHVLRRRV